jgi:hypothetical protein
VGNFETETEDEMSNDAADTLRAYELQAQIRALNAKSPLPVPLKTWAPTMTEQQKQEQDEYVKSNNLPF